MQLPMVPVAKRDRKLIAHLKTNGSGLRITQVVRAEWLAPADKTELGRHELNAFLSLAGPISRCVGYPDAV